jgi:hypothetical protein
MEELMDSWPEYVDHAFRAVSYRGQYEQALDSFAQRWGGLDVEAFTHALEKGSSSPLFPWGAQRADDLVRSG